MQGLTGSHKGEVRWEMTDSTVADLVHSAGSTGTALLCQSAPHPCTPGGHLGASHVTRGGILVIHAGIAQSQDDIEAVVGMVEGCAVNHLGMRG